jgi:NAD(P)-dependent dehydrogenase (short-subunit alcohol dehydrogenase family)
MKKTILITGSTDGIGLLTAKKLAAAGHKVLLHGRSEMKLQSAANEVGHDCESYKADLSNIADVQKLADAVKSNHNKIDVLINNAGVFVIPNPITKDGYDARMMVNTIAPYHLTKLLLPLMDENARVVNLSSAAQSTVTSDAFSKSARLTDGDAYAQSKLAITMWSIELASTFGDDAPAFIAVNPGSFLASKMVKDAYGVAGNDLNHGADILIRAALNEEFASASGRYFDNDSGRFANPHRDALVPEKNAQVVSAIENVINELI